MLRLLTSVMVLILFMAMIAGCFADDDTATVALSSSQTLEIEGNLPNLNAPVLNSTADHAAGIGNSDKYSFSVIDKDTNVEIGTVIANGNSFKATIGILNMNLCPVINVKESKSGRIIYSALFGKIPSASELPAAVKTLKISGISIDAMTTARALIALENKISITETLFTVSTSEVQAGTFIKNYNGQKTAIDNHLETKIIGSDNVNEFAKAVTAVATILTSSNISDNVKNTIAPSITNATQLLTAFVKLAKANDGVLKAVMTANHTANEISLSKIRICSDTDDQTMATIIAKLNVIEKVDNPSFTPDTGTYTQSQNVTITCQTTGAAIYYTLDGTTPTASSALYTGALNVSTTSTIKVIVIKPGMLDSYVVTAAYTINIPVQQAATPVFSIAAGTYAATQSVEITCATPNAKIYYTLDGTAPTSSSTLYSGTLSVSITSTIKAIAIKTGMANSDIAMANYTINIPALQVAKPVFSVLAGTYTTAQTLTITCATPGAIIYYSTNGSDPSNSLLIYTASITIATDMTLKAIAKKAGYIDSSIESADYKVSAPTTPFTLSSTGLTNLGALPSKYAKANANVSPAFTWGTPLAGTKSLMLVCVDDNGTPTNSMDDFIQWGIYNIPPTATGLAEGIAKGATVTSGVLSSGSAAQAMNDYGNTGYDGPDPSAGAARTYAFQLYALNVEPNIPVGANKATILPIIISNVIAGTNLTVFYQK